MSVKRTRTGRLMPRSWSRSISSFRSMAFAGSLVGMDLHVTGVVDREIAVAPARHFVELAGVVHGPRPRGVEGWGRPARSGRWSSCSCSSHDRRSPVFSLRSSVSPRGEIPARPPASGTVDRRPKSEDDQTRTFRVQIALFSQFDFFIERSGGCVRPSLIGRTRRKRVRSRRERIDVERPERPGVRVPVRLQPRRLPGAAVRPAPRLCRSACRRPTRRPAPGSGLPRRTTAV